MKFYTKAVLIGTAALMFSTVQAKTTAKFSGRNLPSDSLAVGGAKDSTAIRGDSASVAAKADSARADSTTRFYNGKLDSLSKALDGQLRAFNLARFGKDTIFTSIPDSTVAQIGAGIQNDYDTAKARLDSLKSALDTMKQKGYAKNAKARKLKKKIAELEGTVEGVKKRAETWNVALVDTSKYSGAPDTSKTAGASPDSLRLSGLKAQFATAKAAVDSANASTIGKAGRLVRKTMKIADDESKKFTACPMSFSASCRARKPRLRTNTALTRSLTRSTRFQAG